MVYGIIVLLKERYLVNRALELLSSNSYLIFVIHVNTFDPTFDFVATCLHSWLLLLAIYIECVKYASQRGTNI